MKKKNEFNFGDVVLVTAKVRKHSEPINDNYNHIKITPISYKLYKPIIGVVSGKSRRAIGYLDHTKEDGLYFTAASYLTVYEIKESFTSKSVIAFPSDMALYNGIMEFNLPNSKHFMSKQDKEWFSKESKNWPRDSRGRFCK